MPPRPAEAAPADVRVITFNTAAGNPAIKTSQADFVRLPFYREAFEGAPGAALLALQEVGPPQARALRSEAARSRCRVLQIRRPGLGNALVIPERYEVLRTRRRYYVFPQLRGIADGMLLWARAGVRPNLRQFGELRMWIEADLHDRVTQHRFTVLTTHLSVEPSLKHRQAAYIVDRALAVARTGIPVILAGDLNVPAGDARGRDVEIARIIGRLQDMGTEAPGRRPNIDYVLAAGFVGISCRIWSGDSVALPGSPDADTVSDHYAEDDVLRFA